MRSTLGQWVTVVVLSGLLLGAQASRLRADDEGANSKNRNSDAQETQALISRALDAALDASELTLAARVASFHGRARQAQNQNAQQQQQPGQPNAQQGPSEQERQRQQQVAQQLWALARKQNETSTKLFRLANENLGREGGENARDDQNAWSRRYYNAANQYANTLRSLIGENTAEGTRVSGTEAQPGEIRREAARPAEYAQRSNDPNAVHQDPHAMHLGRINATSVVLINFAVDQALDSSELGQDQQERGKKSENAICRELRAQAQQDAADSEQVLKQFIANAKQGGEANANANANASNAEEAHWAKVQELARQGQAIVETLQRINSARSGNGRERGERDRD
jgi:hypothetical protein